MVFNWFSLQDVQSDKSRKGLAHGHAFRLQPFALSGDSSGADTRTAGTGKKDWRYGQRLSDVAVLVEHQWLAQNYKS
jgi:hypothetical protein